MARLASGTSMAVTASGNLVLFGSGTHLVIARDQGNVGAVLIAKTRMPGVVRDIIVAGDLAYVACDRRGLAVVDLSDPRTPIQVGFVMTDHALDLAVHGKLVLVAALSSGLLAFDVSEPGEPRLVWDYATTSFAWEVLTHDGVAYLLGDGGVVAIDLVGPGAPSVVSRFVQDRQPRALAHEGGHLFVVGFDRGMDVIDISNPSAPVVVSQVSGSASSGWHIEVDDGLAAVANGELYLLDVSDPSNPVFLASLTTPGDAMASTTRDRTIFVSDSSSGVSVVDVADPSRPLIVDQWITGVQSNMVERVGEIAVIAGPSVLEVVDLSQSDRPVLRGMFDTGGSIQDIALEGSLAFVADLGFGLRIVDLEDPDDPVQIGEYPVDAAVAVAVAGSMATLTNHHTIVVLDITDPSRPGLLGEVPLGVVGWDIELTGETAFLACHEDGVIAVDLSNPTLPRQVGSFSVDQAGGGSAASLTIVDDLAYVAFRLAGLRVLDVSDPRDIREIGQPQNLAINALGVAVDGSLAFVADWHRGLWVFDVSQPDAVTAIDLVEDLGRAVDVVAESGSVVLAAGIGGLPVFDTESCRFGEAAPALSWRPAEPVVGQLVHFAPLELDADEWEWRFDDGPVMTGMLPIRDFRSEGAKVVSLTVMRGSSTETYTRTLDVTQARPRSTGGRIGPGPR